MTIKEMKQQIASGNYLTETTPTLEVRIKAGKIIKKLLCG